MNKKNPFNDGEITLIYCTQLGQHPLTHAILFTLGKWKSLLDRSGINNMRTVSTIRDRSGINHTKMAAGENEISDLKC